MERHRRHLRTLGLCLTAMLAVAAVAASTASASLPEWGGCEYTARGKYTDNACTHKAEHKGEGNYEWYTGAEFGRVAGHGEGEPPFQLANYVSRGELGPATFETQDGKSMHCGDVESETQFELENPNKETKETTKGVKNVVFAFTECESEGQECYSTGHYRLGEVSNNVAVGFENGEDPQGELVFTDKAKGEVGLALTTKQQSTKTEPEYLLKADCEGPVGTVWIGGEKTGKNTIISLISPVDQMTNEFTQTYSQGAKGEQLPHALESGSERDLQAFLEHKWEPIALSASITTARTGEAEPPIEIKAEP
jgi:hypothetical protein